MGLDFRLHCSDCKLDAMTTEFSAVGYIEMKHPDEAEQVVCNWTQFITEHINHRICLKDAFDKINHPGAVNGRYILGIDNK